MEKGGEKRRDKGSRRGLRDEGCGVSDARGRERRGERRGGKEMRSKQKGKRGEDQERRMAQRLGRLGIRSVVRDIQSHP